MAETETIPKPRPGSNTGTIIALAKHTDETNRKIAQKLKITEQAVHDTLKRYGIQRNTLEDYKNNRADILAATGKTILQRFTELAPEEQKDLIKRRGMVDYGILYDKEMQVRGLSGASSKPMVMIQINTPGGAEVRATQVDSQPFGGTFGGIKDEGKT